MKGNVNTRQEKVITIKDTKLLANNKMRFGLEEKKQNDPVKMIFVLGSG